MSDLDTNKESSDEDKLSSKDIYEAMDPLEPYTTGELASRLDASKGRVWSLLNKLVGKDKVRKKEPEPNQMIWIRESPAYGVRTVATSSRLSLSIRFYLRFVFALDVGDNLRSLCFVLSTTMTARTTTSTIRGLRGSPSDRSTSEFGQSTGIRRLSGGAAVILRNCGHSQSDQASGDRVTRLDTVDRGLCSVRYSRFIEECVGLLASPSVFPYNSEA